MGLTKKIIDIHEPKWKSLVVYVATWNITPNKCYLRFTKTKSFPGIWSFDGRRVKRELKTIKLLKKSGSGSFEVYPIPLTWLSQYEEDP